MRRSDANTVPDVGAFAVQFTVADHRTRAMVGGERRVDPDLVAVPQRAELHLLEFVLFCLNPNHCALVRKTAMEAGGNDLRH